MKGRIVATAALMALVSVSACGEAEEQPPRTDATTANLLSSSPSGTPDMSELPTGALPPGSPRIAPPSQPIDVASLGFNSGSAGAPIRVVEMSDYGCSYCRKFHLETWPVILEEFVETGKVEWKFLPFVNGMFANSPAATSAAECVLEQGDELFIPMNSRIWDRQRDWKQSDEPEAMLRGWAREVGAEMDRFDACLSEGRREYRVTAAEALSRQLGVRGTPTFFVVGYPPLQGALDAETFTEVLNLVYQDATGSGG
jgi:protein-disulfide isomerase